MSVAILYQKALLSVACLLAHCDHLILSSNYEMANPKDADIYHLYNGVQKGFEYLYLPFKIIFNIMQCN